MIACSEEKPDFTGNTPIKINDFNKIFKIAALPISISDTNLNRYTDTLTIGRKALEQFIPDSVVESIVSKKDKSAVIHPILKIEKEQEYYLLFRVQHVTKFEICIIVFSKKNKYLGYKVITDFKVENNGSKHYGKVLNINKEPSFLVEENKMSEDNSLTYEKKGWAYIDSTFRLIYFDSNKKPENSKVINPLDTLPMNNSFSGDYSNDPKNFISIRDYSVPNKYQFFLHFEKNNGYCVGELKGLMSFTKNTAIYSEKGDACIIHFKIEGNQITMKEDGNCGNHRNMSCYFNASYDKKRKLKKKK
jgi:hypothetical protein